MSYSQEKLEVLSEPKLQIDVLTSPSDPLWRAGTDLEADVFKKVGYIDSKQELASEYEQYLPKTEIAVIKNGNDVVGSSRFIYFDPKIGFKTLNDFHSGRLILNDSGRKALADINLSETFEVGTLASTKEFRGKPEDETRVAVALYGTIWGESVYHKCQHLLASFDEDYLENFRMIFGPGVKDLGPPVKYMGSLTVPVLMHSKTLLDQIGENFPQVHQTIIEYSAKLNHT